jgi:hypothetical protein
MRCTMRGLQWRPYPTKQFRCSNEHFMPISDPLHLLITLLDHHEE